MKKMKKNVFALLLLILCFSLTACSDKTEKETASDSTEKSFTIVSSFYPMQVLTMNLTNGIDTVKATSMSDPNLGCIHDHTFSTEDLKKIENADVYIENGLDLEVFNDKIKEAYPDTNIIEASTNVTNYVKDGDDINAHVWTDIDNYINQIQYVSEQLQKFNPENKEQYAANEKAYVDKLEQLKSDYADKLSAIAGKKVLVLDETLPSFCVYTKLQEYEIKTDHEQESISADQLKDTINTMKDEGVKSILISKGTDRKNAEAIANETGAKIYELNSCMVGEENVDAYLDDMKENFEIITTIE